MPIDAGLEQKITVCLATRFDKPMKVIRRYFSVDGVEQWGKVRRLDGGDTVHASLWVTDSEDRTDTTFVRVSAALVLPRRPASPCQKTAC